mgnify:CR=1 FL=1
MVYFKERDNYADQANRIEKEICRIMFENDVKTLDLKTSLAVVVVDTIKHIDAVKMEINYGLQELYVRYEENGYFLPTDFNGENINWLQLFAEVLESIEYGILD